MSLTPVSHSITDLLRKTIEQAPGKGWCARHSCPLPDEIQTYNGATFTVYGVCPTCDTETKAQLADAKHQDDLTAMHLRIIRMGVPERYQHRRLQHFHVQSPAQAAVLAVAQRFCGRDINWEEDEAEAQASARPSIESLLLLGNVGTGKTLLACGILMDYTHSDEGTWMQSGLYTTAAQLMRRIKMSWKKDAAETEQDIFTKLAKIDLVVIDEIGVQFNSDTERVLLTELINDRYNAQVNTILVSNLTLKEFTAVVGERIVDRFREGGKVLVFDWPSERGKSRVEPTR